MRVVPEIHGQVQLVKDLATYLYKMHHVFISILLEVNGMKIVEIITCTLKIPAKTPLIVGLASTTQKVLTDCYAVSNLNSAERLFSMNFPSKCESFEITFILILFLKIPNEFVIVTYSDFIFTTPKQFFFKKWHCHNRWRKKKNSSPYALLCRI